MTIMRLAVTVMATISGLVVTSCATVSSPTTNAPDIDYESAMDTVELLFSEPSSVLPEINSCKIDICESLLHEIENAESSIDFAVYGMRNQDQILQALLGAQERGVTVRGIVDRDSDGVNYYSSTDNWVEQLKSIRDDGEFETPPSDGDASYTDRCERPSGRKGPLQCLVYDFSNNWILAEHAAEDDFAAEGSGGASNRIMHNKFFVFDQKVVWTGSANISDTGIGGYNANLVARIKSAEIAQDYLDEFEQMWSGDFHSDKQANTTEDVRVGDATVRAFFSPQDNAMLTVVTQAISEANSVINASVFYLTDKRVTAELLAAHQRGVEIRIIIDATAAQNGYSKHEILRLAGIPVKVETWGGKMHMKSVSIDHETLIVGSMNWTGAGSTSNDENVLLIRSPRLAEAHDDFFEGLWTSIDERWMQYGNNPLPESMDSPVACADTIDNDFDGLIDEEDPSCSSVEVDMAPDSQRFEQKGSPTKLPSGYTFQPSIRGPDADSQENCDPNYSGICLPVLDPDIDCPQVNAKSFHVIGRDIHTFDSDADREACER